MNQTSRPRGLLATVFVLFFASGALALVYQVVWTRMMTHVFGSTAVAVGTVLAAFMGGLAIGSWYFGRIADRVPDRLRLYARIEVGIAIAAGVSHLALDRLDALYPALYDVTGGMAPLLAAVRFLCAFALVMGPTVLMGATLPVLGRLVVDDLDRVGLRLGALYAVNTAGAVIGVLVTGFWLIGAVGVHVPAYLAMAGNLTIGLVAWIAAGRYATALDENASEVDAKGEPPAGRDEAEHEPLDRFTLRLLLVALGISGFTSFAYEIYWTRSLVFILGNSTYALSTMLSAFLTGIALGAWGVRFLIPRVRDRVAAFGWLQVALGTFSALALPLLFAVGDPQSLSGTLLGLWSEAIPLVVASFGIAFLVMLLPATLIGATFPLVGHVAVSELDRAGTDVGRVYAVNTAGNVLGALAPGWFLLAWLGIQGGIVAMAIINITLGLVILAVRFWRPGGARSWRFVVPAIAVAAAALVSRAPLDFQFPAEGEQPHFETLFYREGPLGTTKVQSDPRTGEKHMSVDGIVIGGTGNSQFKQLLLAHLPRLLIDDVPTELSVGLGSGILAGESARHSDLEAITVIEIEPTVVDGAAQFSRENHDVLDDPRMELVTDDVASFLRTTDRRWHAITADEKTADEYASNGFSYSVDYYRLLANHLVDGGVVVQWVPATLPPRQFQMILKSFSESFEHMQLWYFLPAYHRGPFNAVLVGSHEAIALDYQTVQDRFERRSEALASLRPFGLTSAVALLPHFVADDEIVRAEVASAPVNTLDHPRYEFYHPWDYAADRKGKTLANHVFLLDLKRRAHGGFFEQVSQTAPDPAWLQKTFAAEFRYLELFGMFLDGLSAPDHFRFFDRVLEIAPWNDSLRARLYSQYRHLAASEQNPELRRRYHARAEALYHGD
jgi:spermidine synthase